MADCSWFRSVIESIDPAIGATAQRGCYARLNSVLPGHRPDFPAPLGFSLDAIKHWDGGRRTPEAPARTPLTVIDRNPTAMLTALTPAAFAAAGGSSKPSDQFTSVKRSTKNAS